jgi:hypothetical protein
MVEDVTILVPDVLGPRPLNVKVIEERHDGEFRRTVKAQLLMVTINR